MMTLQIQCSFIEVVFTLLTQSCASTNPFFYLAYICINFRIHVTHPIMCKHKSMQSQHSLLTNQPQ